MLFVIFYYRPWVGNSGLVVFYETSICKTANVGKEKNLFSPNHLGSWLGLCDKRQINKKKAHLAGKTGQLRVNE